MASSNKKVIRDLFTRLAKRYPKRPVILAREREVLEHLVYGMFLENTSFQNAADSFATLETYFVDWNEIRVSTADELADVFPLVNNAKRMGERLRRSLQWIFDKIYKFDLEEFRARGAAETLAFLESVPYMTPFINAYIIAVVFKPQDIPLDEGTLRVLRLLDLVEVNDENREEVRGLSSSLTQADKMDFFFRLHLLGAEFMDETKQESVIAFLRKIDDEVDMRTWLPLVDTEELTDPVLIAKQLSRQQEHKPKLPLSLQLDEELELVDSEIVEEDESVLDISDEENDEIEEPVRVDIIPDFVQTSESKKKNVASVSNKKATSVSDSKKKSDKPAPGKEKRTGKEDASDSSKSTKVKKAEKVDAESSPATNQKTPPLTPKKAKSSPKAVADIQKGKEGTTSKAPKAEKTAKVEPKKKATGVASKPAARPDKKKAAVKTEQKKKR